MTEKTDYMDKSVHDIDSAAFWVALIAAPLIVAVLFFWVYLIPVFAVILGGVPWLLLGGPVLWHSIRTYGPGLVLIPLAMFANLVGTPLFLAAVNALSNNRPMAAESASFFTAYGMVFSALWSAVFLMLYRRIASA